MLRDDDQSYFVTRPVQHRSPTEASSGGTVHATKSGKAKTKPLRATPRQTDPAFRVRIEASTDAELLHLLRQPTTTVNQQDNVRLLLAARGVYVPIHGDDPVIRLHHLLGHRSWRQTLAFARQHSIALGRYGQVFCDTCAQYKLRRIPYDATMIPPEIRQTMSEPFYFWSIDVHGPYEVSAFGKFKLVLGFLDICTRNFIPVFMSGATADHIATALGVWLRWLNADVRRARDHNITLTLGGTIGSDGAAAFQTDRVNRVFKDLGFKYRHYSAPYTPQATHVERTLKTIADSVNTALSASGQPRALWPEAWTHMSAVYSILPHRALGGRSPHEAMFGTVPEWRHLHPFGAPAILLRAPATVSKGEPRGRQAMYVGYHPPQQKLHVRLPARQPDLGESHQPPLCRRRAYSRAIHAGLDSSGLRRRLARRAS
jgi:hypothetical protein